MAVPEQNDTIVGANVELKGSLKNQGPIVIHGKVIGDIISDSLVTIGETAQISGPVTAKRVDVSGQVHGSITAEEQIELQAKSIVQGDLTTSRLSIKPGAVFVGTSNMTGVTIPETEGVDKKKPRLEVD